MAEAHALGACGLGRGGSTPFTRTESEGECILKER